MLKRNLKKMVPVTLAAITALTSVFVLGNTKHAAYGEELIKNSQGDEITIKYGDINGDGSINVVDVDIFHSFNPDLFIHSFEYSL